MRSTGARATFLATCLTLASCASEGGGLRPVEREPRARVVPAAAEREREPAPADAELEHFVRGYYEDFGRRDWSAFAARFWPGATVVARRRPAGGGPEAVVATSVTDYLAEAQSASADPAPILYELSPRLLHSDGTVALLRVAYVARKDVASEPQTWRGVEVFLLVSHDRQWRIAALAFSAPGLDP